MLFSNVTCIWPGLKCESLLDRAVFLKCGVCCESHSFRFVTTPRHSGTKPFFNEEVKQFKNVDNFDALFLSLRPTVSAVFAKLKKDLL